MNALFQSDFDREEHDHYGTPIENLAALLIGLRDIGISLPNRVADTSAGKGILARGLTQLCPGAVITQTDLFPEAYAADNFNLAPEPFDAGDTKDLGLVLRATGARAIVSNPPYEEPTHARILDASLSALRAGQVDLVAFLHWHTHIASETAALR
jgi:methylase of polypeptide subunit release factors